MASKNEAPKGPCNEDNFEEVVDLTGETADFSAEETNPKGADA